MKKLFAAALVSGLAIGISALLMAQQPGGMGSGGIMGRGMMEMQGRMGEMRKGMGGQGIRGDRGKPRGSN